jgi:hypothetical protein
LSLQTKVLRRFGCGALLRIRLEKHITGLTPCRLMQMMKEIAPRRKRGSDLIVR